MYSTSHNVVISLQNPLRLNAVSLRGKKRWERIIIFYSGASDGEQRVHSIVKRQALHTKVYYYYDYDYNVRLGCGSSF